MYEEIYAGRGMCFSMKRWRIWQVLNRTKHKKSTGNWQGLRGWSKSLLPQLFLVAKDHLIQTSGSLDGAYERQESPWGSRVVMQHLVNNRGLCFSVSRFGHNHSSPNERFRLAMKLSGEIIVSGNFGIKFTYNQKPLSWKRSVDMRHKCFD